MTCPVFYFVLFAWDFTYQQRNITLEGLLTHRYSHNHVHTIKSKIEALGRFALRLLLILYAML